MGRVDCVQQRPVLHNRSTSLCSFHLAFPASLQDQCLADRMAQGSCLKRLIMLLPAKSIEREPIIKGFFSYLLPQ